MIQEELTVAEFVRMGDGIKDAILTIMKYIKTVTGTEPSQEDVATLLKSYFIVNEVGNQIKYQLNKGTTAGEDNDFSTRSPFWKMNLMGGPGQNILARAGVFHRSIKEAIDSTRQYMKKTMGADPDDNVIARSLKSSFILSEIKNQYDYQRKQSRIKSKSAAAKTRKPKAPV
jgi:hypothetical protein